MELILKQYQALIEDIDDLTTLMANTAAFIYYNFDDISWAGFYLDRGAMLHLGPFQGKVACTKIAYDRGVCGTSYSSNQVLNVPNVHDFVGHIACDSATNSELVLPIYIDGRGIGVLDLDSIEFDRFDPITQAAIEKLVAIFKTQMVKCH